MCGRLVNLDTVARVLAEYYHLKTDTQLAALDEALSKVPAVSIGGGHEKDHVADPGNMVGDSISRQAAIDALTEAYEDIDAEWILRKLPSAQRTGKWLDANICGELPVIVCDQCNTFYPLSFGEFHNFCPNCGAKMEVDDE